MKKFKCDVCGKEVGEYGLNTLYENIQQKEIKDMCDECNKEVTTANAKIKAVLAEVRAGWLQSVINKIIARNN